MLIQTINCYNNPNFSAKNVFKRITNSMGRNPRTGKVMKSSKDVRLPQNSTSFQAKCIPQSMRKNIEQLMQRIDSEAVITPIGNGLNRETRVSTLDIGNKAKFKDGRFLAKKDKDNNWIPYGDGTSMIEFGKVKILSDSDGNILFCKKPFFSRWKTIFKKADAYIKTALNNYNNDNVIIKTKKEKVRVSEESIQEAGKHIMATFDALSQMVKGLLSGK